MSDHHTSPEQVVSRLPSSNLRELIRKGAADLTEARDIPPERFPGHKATYCANLEGWLGSFTLALLNALEETEADVREALDAIDRHAERDLDHELHALVDRYRRALGC